MFLEEMEQVVPWKKLCGLIGPHYPNTGNGRPPVGVECMLRICFLQQWFNLSDLLARVPSGGTQRQFNLFPCPTGTRKAGFPEQ